MKVMGGIVMIVGILSVVPAMAGDYGGGFTNIGRARKAPLFPTGMRRRIRRAVLPHRGSAVAVTKVRSARSPA